jgi:hypothetical protein
MDNKCKDSQILRKAYTKRSGSKVKATCIEDKGQPGHGPKTLPPLDKNLSLSKFGYKLDKPEKTRRTSLKKASKKYSTISVLKRVNLIRNYSKSIPKNYDKLSNDVDYLKKQYAIDKKNGLGYHRPTIKKNSKKLSKKVSKKSKKNSKKNYKKVSKKI